MLLVPVVTEHHVQSVRLRVLPEADRLARRVLTVIVEVHEVRAAGVPPAGQHGVVLAEIPRVLDERDRNTRMPQQLAAHLAGPVAAAVVHEHDLMAAVDVERLDVADQTGNRVGTLKERDDEAHGGIHGHSHGH